MDFDRTDLKQVLANSPEPGVKELLKALQLTIEFEAQLTKRYEKHVLLQSTFPFSFLT